MESQRIVIIQDASKEVYSNAIQWALKGLSLKPGDDLTVLGVVHQDDISSLLPPAGAGKSRKIRFLLNWKTKQSEWITK